MNILNLMFDKNKKALNYMNQTYGEKFGDEFALIDAEYAGILSGADTFYLSTRRFPEFSVLLERLEGKYYTSYIEVAYYKQYQEYMQPIFEEIFGECKVFMEFTMLASAVYTEDTTFEEYMKETDSPKSAKIIVRDDSNMEEKLKQAASSLKELNLQHGELMVYSVKDYEAVSKMDNLVELKKYEDSEKELIYNSRFFRLNMGRNFTKLEISERSLEY